MNTGNGNYRIKRVVREQLHPKNQLKTPMTVVFDTFAVLITAVFLGSWIFIKFSADLLEFMLLLWGLVVFINLCELVAGVKRDNQNSDDKEREIRQ
jgi:hypothetical protein